MNATNTVKALVRSLTPWAISVVASVIAHFGYHVSLTTASQITVAVGTVLTIGAHVLERRFPWVGVFLGWIGAPAYAPSVKQSLALKVASLEAEIDALVAAASEKAHPSQPSAGPGAPGTDANATAVPSAFTPAPTPVTPAQP